MTLSSESNVVIEEKPYESFLNSGNTQWFLSSPKGKISLICLPRKYYKDCPWEIYSIEGNLFEDVERFSSHEQAVKKAKEYLD